MKAPIALASLVGAGSLTASVASLAAVAGHRDRGGREGSDVTTAGEDHDPFADGTEPVR